MSYRSIKRVLGETSLERKCRFLFGACLLLLITASFWWYGSQTEKMVYRQNRNTGRLLVDQVMYIKHWESLETNEKFLPLVQDLTKRLSKQEYEWRFLKPNSTDGASAPRDEFEWAVLDRYNKPQAQRPASADPEDYPEPEVVLLLHRSHFKVVEIPARMRRRMYGKSTISLARGLFYVLKVSVCLLLDMVRQPWPSGKIDSP